MEKSTSVGVIMGVAAVGVGMALKGADPHSLINPAAFLIIIVGTAAALFNAFTMKELKKFPKLLKIIFAGHKQKSKQEILDLFVSLAKTAKTEGVVGIERIANDMDDPFIKTG